MHEMLAIAPQRDGLQARARDACRPWDAELEVAADAGIEQVQQVRAGGDPEARRELARDGGATDLLGGLEHEHVAARASPGRRRRRGRCGPRRR